MLTKSRQLSSKVLTVLYIQELQVWYILEKRMFSYNLPHLNKVSTLEIARCLEAPCPLTLMRFSGFDADAKKYVVASPEIQRLTAGYNCQLHCLPCHFITDSAL